MGETELRGRAAEIAILDALVADARGGRAGVVEVCGEPGIGKTALADLAAAAPGLRILRALGVQGESRMPFAALSELLRPLSRPAGDLPAVQREAVCSLLDGSSPVLTDRWGGGNEGRPAADQYVLGAATLALLARAAEDGPLLVIVDDTHWVDDLSGVVLSFAFRRLQADAVAVLLCRRPRLRRPVAGPWREMTLHGIGVEDASALLAGATAAVVRSLHAVTAGNPLALRELRRTLTAEQLAGRAPLPDPLPLGEHGTAAFAGRVSELPAATRQALTVVAAAGPAGVGLLAAALDRVGVSAADLGPAEHDGLITFDGNQPAFTHPLVRAAVFAEATPASRRAAHAALAAAVKGRDAQQYARHLAAASPLVSEDVARALEVAAVHAELRGGPAAGAEARFAAARLSPDGPARDERRLRAAESGVLAGRRSEAADLAESVLAGTTGATTRHRALALRASLASWTVGLLQAIPTMHAAFDELAVDAPDLAALLAFGLAAALVNIGRLSEARGVSGRARQLPITDPLMRFLIEHRHATVLVFLGDLGAYGEIEHRFPLATYAEPARRRYPMLDLMSGQELMIVERFADAAAVIEQDLDAARRSAAPRLLPVPLMLRADLALLTGDALRAGADLDEALDLTDVMDLSVLAGLGHGLRARSAAWTGDERGARQHAAAAVDGAEAYPPVQLYASAALGLLELGLGRPAVAAQHYRLADEVSRTSGLRNPIVVTWQADHVEALHGAGRLDEARRALADLDATAATTGSRWARGAAARCHAVLGDPDWPQLCAAALADQEDLPFERGRTLLLHGSLLRRERQVTESRGHLAAAVEVLTRAGATPWAARARAELRAAGVSSPEPIHPAPALTGQELRVCLAVAEGVTNREAAAALFVSPKTVEHHLGRAFAKLGVTNRAQLTRLVADGVLAQLPR